MSEAARRPQLPQADEALAAWQAAEVEARVIAVLAAQASLAPEAIRRDAALDDLGLDSLALVETLFALEEAFDISIPFNANEPREGGDLGSVASLSAAVVGLIAAKSA